MQELSLNVLDIAQNCITAGADAINIEVRRHSSENKLTVIISDNGCGMTPEQVKNAQNPFYTTRKTRKVGLGIPFYKMAAECTGGSFEIFSEVGVGTRVTAVFKTDNIDCMPLGNIASTMAQLICLNEDRLFTYIYEVDGREFTASTSDFTDALDGVPLSVPEVMSWIEEYINEKQNETVNHG